MQVTFRHLLTHIVVQEPHDGRHHAWAYTFQSGPSKVIAQGDLQCQTIISQEALRIGDDDKRYRGNARQSIVGLHLLSSAQNFPLFFTRLLHKNLEEKKKGGGEGRG